MVDGRNLFFFANSSDATIDTHVRLRGKLAVESWDPHRGGISKAESTEVIVKGKPTSCATRT